jgi:hypothetical protein
VSQLTHSLTSILLKIAILGLLVNFGAIFSGEGLAAFKKPEDMLKSIVLSS